MRASSAGSSLASVDEGQPARCWWPSLSSNARPRATAARECRSSLTLPLRRSVSSSWRTSRPVRWSSATVWGPIQPPVVRTTGTRHSTSAHRGCQRTSHCQVFTGSPRSPSDGFSALTKAPAGGRPPAGVPQRVLLPFQPKALASARVALLPPDAPCRRRATAHLPASRGEPPAQAASPHRTARAAAATRDPGPPTCGPALAPGYSTGVSQGPSDGYPDYGLTSQTAPEYISVNVDTRLSPLIADCRGPLDRTRSVKKFESPDIKVGRSQRTGTTCAVSPAHLSSSNNYRLNTLRRLLAAAEQAPQPERGLRRRPSTEARKYCSGRSQKNP